MATQALLLGLGAGALDALLALSIVLLYRITGVLNFAQAATGAVGAYVIYGVGSHHPLWMGVGAGLLISGVLGASTYVAVAGLRSRHYALTAAVATLAVAILFRQVISAIWGTTVGTMPDPFGGRTYTVANASLTASSLTSIVLSAVIALAIGAFLRWSRAGVMLRAIADHPEAARLCGAPLYPMIAGVWFAAGVLSATAGFFAGLLGLTPSFLDPFFLSALLAALLGGLRSLPAAWLAAVGLEVTRNVFGLYAPTSISVYTEALLIVLVVIAMSIAPKRWLSASRQRTI